MIDYEFRVVISVARGSQIPACYVYRLLACVCVTRVGPSVHAHEKLALGVFCDKF